VAAGGVECGPGVLRRTRRRLAAIRAAGGFEKVKRIDDAVEALIVDDETKRRYLLLAAGVAKLYRAILPDPAAAELAPDCVLLGVIADKIRSLTPPADISEVMEAVEDLLNRSIAAEPYVIRDPADEYGSRVVDLSRIDFEALRARFLAGRKRIEAERLRALLSAKLVDMLHLNRSRIDYLAKFQQMIDEYNAGSLNVEEFFEQLVAFARELDAEDKRGIGEQLSEEELALFDLLTKPEPNLTRQEQQAVKTVARELLQTLKREKLVLDWRRRQATRAAVEVCIQDMLDRLPPAYSPAIYQQKCGLVYQHVYDSYFGEGHSIFPPAA
jgi:type I restriction enzyme, R subunit